MTFSPMSNAPSVPTNDFRSQGLLDVVVASAGDDEQRQRRGDRTWSRPAFDTAVFTASRPDA
jgi:hypothetical protein